MKKILRQCEGIIVFLLKIFVYLLVFWVFYRIYAIKNWQLLALSRTSMVTIVGYFISGYLFLKIYGGYDIGKRKSKPIIISLSLAGAFTDLVGLLMLSIMNTNEKLNDHFIIEQPWLIPIIIVMQVMIISFMTYFGNWLYFKICDPERVLIVTSSRQSLQEITRCIKKYRLQYKICCNMSYQNEKLKEVIPKYDTVFIYDVPVKERTEIVEYCYQNMKNVYINPMMADVVELHSNHVLLDDMSLLQLSSIGLKTEQRFFKRIMDIFISSIALIITSPILLIAAIAVKAYDGGNVFFKQNRATRGGKIFRVYKLRTMKENVDNYLQVVDDDRITPVGKILRRFRIDEIPQFINVLKGDMSVVGDRALRCSRMYSTIRTSFLSLSTDFVLRPVSQVMPRSPVSIIHHREISWFLT